MITTDPAAAAAAKKKSVTVSSSGQVGFGSSVRRRESVEDARIRRLRAIKTKLVAKAFVSAAIRSTEHESQSDSLADSNISGPDTNSSSVYTYASRLLPRVDLNHFVIPSAAAVTPPS